MSTFSQGTEATNDHEGVDTYTTELKRHHQVNRKIQNRDKICNKVKVYTRML